MEKLTTAMKDAIKDKIDNITKIAKDYINIIDHDYKFVGGYEENMFYSQFHKAMKSKLLEIENILDDLNNTRKYIEIGPDFIDWADTYFQDKFNKVVDGEQAFFNYKNSLPLRSQSFVKKKTFTSKLRLWCEIKGYTYNPEDVMKLRTETERKRNEIRWNDKDINGNTVSVYGFYIENKEEDNQ